MTHPFAPVRGHAQKRVERAAEMAAFEHRAPLGHPATDAATGTGSER